MAEKKIIEIEVKTQDAVKSMDALSKSTKEAGKEFDKAATFAERYGEELQPLTTRMGEAEDRLYELANAGQTTTQEYKELLKSVGDFRKVQISTDMAVDAAATTMGQKLGGALGGVTSGFSLAQGAFAAFGSESKEVEQALLKVQAAMAIQQGVQGIREAIPAIRALATEIRAVVSATGIGLIVVSLGLVYTYWEDISKAISFAGGETEKYAKQQKAIGEEAKKQSEEVAKESGAFATLISRLKATNQNTKEREELIKKINTQYGTTLKNIKDERNFQEQLNTELASYLEYQKAKYSLQKNEDLIVRNLEKKDKIKREILKTEKELKAAAIEILEFQQAGSGILESQSNIPKLKEKLKDLREEYGNAKDRFVDYGEAAQNAAIKVDILTDSGTKYVEQIVNDAPKITETLNQFKQDVDNLNEEIRVSKLNDEEKEIDALNKKYDKVIEEGKKHGVNVKALEEEKRLALAAITKKYDDADASTRLTNSQTVISNIVSEGTKRLQAEKAIGDKSTEQLKKELQDQTALRERNLKFIIESMIQILSITQDLASMSENKYKEINDKVLANENLTTAQKEKAIIKNNANAKKAFELNKKFQIASTLISTFAAARDAYKSQFLPPDISSPVRGGIAAGIATAGGLVAVKKIMSTQFQGTAVPSGGDSGGGGATVPTMSAPQFNVVGQSGVNQLASLNQQPIQAYVVSGQVTSQQALDRNRLANATLGG